DGDSLLPIFARNHRTNPQGALHDCDRLSRVVEVFGTAVLRRRFTPNRIFLANGSRVRRTDPLHRWRPLHTDPHRRSEWRIVAARWCSQGRGVRRPLGAVDSGSVCLATPAKHGYRTVRRIEPRRGLALEMLAAGSLRRSLPENPRHARTAFGSELWPRWRWGSLRGQSRQRGSRPHRLQWFNRPTHGSSA